MIPAHRRAGRQAQVTAAESVILRNGRGSGYVQHVELAEVGVNEPSVLEHLPHVLHHLQVELAGLGLRQRGVLKEGGGPTEPTRGASVRGHHGQSCQSVV